MLIHRFVILCCALASLVIIQMASAQTLLWLAYALPSDSHYGAGAAA